MENQIIEFIHNHLLLVILLLVIIVAIIWYEVKNAGAAGLGVNPHQVTMLINRENALVLDIRDIESYKAGHIINAMHMLHDSLQDKIKKLNKYRDKPIIVCDQQGQQAAKVAQLLKAKEFNNVRIIQGGINAWRAANLPLVTE